MAKLHLLKNMKCHEVVKSQTVSATHGKRTTETHSHGVVEQSQNKCNNDQISF